MSRIAPAIVYVSYEGTPEDRFDRSYYVERHLPLVMQAWRRYGLEHVCAFFPALAEAGTLAICECVFRDEAAIQAAFESDEAEQVMADVASFTDISPTRLRVARL
ncbi:EthD family reductase [bacterium M00.F.Ca.ET.228.01.1.1]|uniref:EthD family reductase n=1 Tax=Paraburkholderia phenoliruptrix TaxID=252970 RepID=UPI001091A882|nr:EthD family reductase [Paraburkholderia phenoliruptrix]TGP45794.1 EthD family reductase [bacterium M00.F.Ca.ET.228.01.1.1]TGS04294.1 EthD family reductase [bacterium M00.F.Ca.ET.191.01.1.1]TGU07087.1 EthD family reductase [bacterium M00.F.Ca.ET.155.01.1.1]MBW0448479.1 EthD family reductase [Paraburkholderia phenoliruptrix]MBW9100659.1 EthD family reductase [Paraburkholderia phenoliruptrix]